MKTQTLDLKKAIQGILVATAISGTLDAIAAVGVFDFATGKMSILQILQWIATGAFGESAFQMGLAGAAWGVFFHYVIAVAFSAGIFAIYRKLPVLRDYPVFSGLAYGGYIWIGMNFIVLPLSRTVVAPFEPGIALVGFLWHMTLVGLPMVLIARHFFEGSWNSDKHSGIASDKSRVALVIFFVAAVGLSGHADAKSSAQKVRFGFEEIQGQKIFYREAGDAKSPVIVLLHGFPSSSHMFRDLIPYLSAKFHVIAPDYPGFGHSSQPKVEEFAYTFDHFAEIVEALLERKGASKYVLYLQDYGGPVGMRIATAHPERVKGLVIQNSNAYMEGVGKPVADVFLPLWKEQNETTLSAAKAFLKPETTKFQYTAGAKNPAALNPDAWIFDQALLDRPGNEAIQLALFLDYQKNLPLYETWQKYFRDKKPRTLIVWGKNDPLFVEPGAKAYLKDLPKAKLVLLEGGHFALEEHAGEISRQIVGHFR